MKSIDELICEISEKYHIVLNCHRSYRCDEFGLIRYMYEEIITALYIFLLKCLL